MLFRKTRADLAAIQERDPAARSKLEIALLYSGFHAVLWYRVAHFFHRHHLYFLARLISQTGRLFTGVEIHPGAQIGRGLLIDHGSGVVIGDNADIGDTCTMSHGVTLGGTGKGKGKRHPTLGNNVMVGSGAKILGPFTVGDGARIAAGAVVLAEVPPDATAVGVPAKVVRLSGKRVVDLDQVNIPDPVAQELTRLEQRIEELEEKLNEKEHKENQE